MTVKGIVKGKYVIVQIIYMIVKIEEYMSYKIEGICR